jgi:hypothetical protein
MLSIFTVASALCESAFEFCVFSAQLERAADSSAREWLERGAA